MKCKYVACKMNTQEENLVLHITNLSYLMHLSHMGMKGWIINVRKNTSVAEQWLSMNKSMEFASLFHVML